MKKLLIVLFLAAFFPAKGTAAETRFGDSLVVSDRILIEPQTGAVDQAVRSLGRTQFSLIRAGSVTGRKISPASLRKKSTVPPVRFLEIAVPNSMSIEDALESAAKLPGVKAAWPNYLHKALDFVPDDPIYEENQANLRQVRFPAAWDFSFGSGVTVAVIDTGYRSGLDDAATLVSPYDIWGGDEDVQDYVGHGTLVANVIAEASNNGIGCASIAPASRIMPLKVFPDWDGGAEETDIILAIDRARTEGANVINMSLGGGGYTGATDAAVNDAWQAGIVIFAASGNDGSSPVSYPAGYPNVIAVGSSSPHEPGAHPARSDFSNFGTGLALLAPGEGIVQQAWASSNGIGYYGADGTSVASPHAAGLAALLMSFGPPGMTPDDVRQIMIDSANSDKSDWDEELGWGEIDAKAAITLLTSTVPNEPPQANITASAAEGRAPLTIHFSAAGSFDPEDDIVDYLWSLPDMSTAHGASVEFTFTEGGIFDVILTVRDKYGKSDSASTTVAVADPEKKSDAKNDSGGCSISSEGAPVESAALLLLLVSLGLVLKKKL